MSKCGARKCGLCNSKNADGIVRKHYIAYGIGRDEANRDWNKRTKAEQSRLLRTRMKRQLRNLIEEIDQEFEDDWQEFLEELDSIMNDDMLYGDPYEDDWPYLDTSLRNFYI